MKKALSKLLYLKGFKHRTNLKRHIDEIHKGIKRPKKGEGERCKKEESNILDNGFQTEIQISVYEGKKIYHCSSCSARLYLY